MGFVLHVNSGVLSGKFCTLPEGRKVVVGRSFGCDVGIPSDIYLSSSHFCIENRADGCSIADLDSRNGTFVNSQRVEGPAVLHDGDIIFAGATLFTIQQQSAANLNGQEIPLGGSSQFQDSATFEAPTKSVSPTRQAS